VQFLGRQSLIGERSSKSNCSISSERRRDGSRDTSLFLPKKIRKHGQGKGPDREEDHQKVLGRVQDPKTVLKRPIHEHLP